VIREFQADAEIDFEQNSLTIYSYLEEIVEGHHGRIEVESQVGVGTTFRVWLLVRDE
jgi:light-regulated signal transduction histidine kinase (bacteriophytochrome)